MSLDPHDGLASASLDAASLTGAASSAGSGEVRGPLEASSAGDQNTVIGKLQLILEAFGPDDHTVSLSELARRTTVSKATVHRLCRELVRWGLLERQGSDYRLGMRLFEIGQRVPRQRILREASRPFMEDLYQATGETIHLAVLDGLDVMYLEKVAGHGQVTKPSRVAGRVAAHATATGKVLLAFSSQRVVDEVLSQPLQRLTPHTTVQPRMLLAELQRARETGHALEREQTKIGYLSVAVPLTGTTGTTVAALSVTAPLFRAKVDQYANLLDMVRRRIAKTMALNGF